MTEILNEQICASVKSSTDNVHLVCEVRLSRAGKLISVLNGAIYYLSSDGADQTYVGTFAVSYSDVTESKQSISVNVNDSDYFAKATTAVTNMIKEIEEKYS